ncbi:MAG TPA: histidine phosphatase family protein [Microlunatus sp.]
MSTGSQSGRTLWLLRHAKSDQGTGLPDHERPLNERGVRDATATGRLLVERGWRPDLVLCSSSVRTRQTWEHAAAAGGTAGEVRIEPRIYDASAATLLDVVRTVDQEVGSLLLVGHGPGVPGLADRLGSRPEPREVWRRMDEKYPTSGLAMLHFDASWAGVDAGELVAFETPRG